MVSLFLDVQQEAAVPTQTVSESESLLLLSLAVDMYYQVSTVQTMRLIALISLYKKTSPVYFLLLLFPQSHSPITDLSFRNAFDMGKKTNKNKKKQTNTAVTKQCCSIIVFPANLSLSTDKKFHSNKCLS